MGAHFIYARGQQGPRRGRGAECGLEGRIRERTADLQRANDEIQRFAYIVSHDLRAPLVNVMGFTSRAEDVARGLQALTADPAIDDLAGGSGGQEPPSTPTCPRRSPSSASSTQKMDSLINAILKLSREGRRTLEAGARSTSTRCSTASPTACSTGSTRSGGELAIERAAADARQRPPGARAGLRQPRRQRREIPRPERPPRIAVRGATRSRRVAF